MLKVHNTCSLSMVLSMDEILQSFARGLQCPLFERLTISSLLHLGENTCDLYKLKSIICIMKFITLFIMNVVNIMEYSL